MGWAKKILLKVVAGISYLSMRFCYSWWSKLWRWILERDYRNVQIAPSSWTVPEVVQFFRGCTWKQDAWYYLDAIGSPEKFWITKEGDCDEFACFAGNVLTECRGYIMSVTWYNPAAKGRKWSGHNVFVFRQDDHWWHIGNWGLFGPYDCELTAVALKVAACNSPTTIPMACSIRDSRTLKWSDGKVLFKN